MPSRRTLIILIGERSSDFRISPMTRSRQAGPVSAHPVPEAPEWVFSDQTVDADRYATLVEGRRLTVSFPRADHDIDRGTAEWSAYWEDEHQAGVDRAFHGDISFKHHITAYDVGLVVPRAALRATASLPGIVRPG
jgi:hypothetical protein